MNKKQLAKFMHDTYETKSLELGWNTQKKCKVPFNKLPKENKKVMIAVAEEVLKETRKDFIKNLYWIFRDAIHNSHVQIEIFEGKIDSFKPLNDTTCYVCDIINKIEKEVAGLFGKEYYTAKKV